MWLCVSVCVSFAICGNTILALIHQIHSIPIPIPFSTTISFAIAQRTINSTLQVRVRVRLVYQKNCWRNILRLLNVLFVRFVYCYTARIYDTTANTIKRMHNGERRTVIAMINARKSYFTYAVYALSHCFYEFMVLLMKQIRTCAAIGWSKKKGYHFFLVQSKK